MNFQVGVGEEPVYDDEQVNSTATPTFTVAAGVAFSSTAASEIATKVELIHSYFKTIHSNYMTKQHNQCTLMKALTLYIIS